MISASVERQVLIERPRRIAQRHPQQQRREHRDDHGDLPSAIPAQFRVLSKHQSLPVRAVFGLHAPSPQSPVERHYTHSVPACEGK